MKIKEKLIKGLKNLFKLTGLLSLIVCGLITTVIVSTCVSCNSIRKLENYKKYYRATETLLDSLESKTNWTDRYDFGETYDNYVMSKVKL